MELDLTGLTGFKVCTVCFDIYGTWVETRRGAKKPRVLTQSCRCNKPTRPKRTYPGYDFNTYAELCLCCGVVPVWSGHRFAMYFCERCRKVIVRLNRAAGRALIPIARHSIINGSFRREPEGKPADIALAELMVNMWAGTELLIKWNALVVAGHLKAAGLDEEDPPLLTYLEEAGPKPGTRSHGRRSFEKMWKYLQPRLMGSRSRR